MKAVVLAGRSIQLPTSFGSKRGDFAPIEVYWTKLYHSRCHSWSLVTAVVPTH